MSHKPIAQQFKSTMQYKYSVGDKVCVTNHKYNGDEGVIVALMPWMLVFPGYDVEIDSVVVAISERSIETIGNIVAVRQNGQQLAVLNKADELDISTIALSDL